MASLISRNPRIQFGAYCVAGTRIPVATLKNMAKVESIDALQRTFGLSREQVLAALRFRNPYFEEGGG